MEFQKDILLGAEDDLIIANGDFSIGDSVLQEVGIILLLNTGELKSDPIMSPNLIQLVKGKDSGEFEDRCRLFLKRDNKNFEELKKYITLNKVL